MIYLGQSEYSFTSHQDLNGNKGKEMKRRGKKTTTQKLYYESAPSSTWNN
eukprot:m.67888 g.67888  ORF g.67888 m.67888 type:complete len:50 (-) comp13654_c0_seq1:2407-2556(-)